MPAGNFNNNTIYYHLSKSYKTDDGRDTVAILQGSKDNVKTFNYLQGTLVDIKPYDGEYDGQPTYRIRFIFSDGVTEEQLECGRYTGFTRDVLNCLASLDAIDEIRITPFLSEDKNTGKKYVRGSVRFGPDFSSINSKTSKKYSADEIPKIQMVRVGKKEQVDSSELDDWTDALIQEVKAKISKPGGINDAAPGRTKEDKDFPKDWDDDKF